MDFKKSKIDLTTTKNLRGHFSDCFVLRSPRALFKNHLLKATKLQARENSGSASCSMFIRTPELHSISLGFQTVYSFLKGHRDKSCG